jgi:glyoxylase-like metal-dependent hydrolase (beta-lactamase superfamily II)
MKQAPSECLICQDERQYVGWNGQEWTSLQGLQNTGHKNHFEKKNEKNLYSITTRPEFAIGQRAFLLQTRKGKLLWDCVSYFDQDTKKQVENLGGLDVIAISHPHYYSAMAEWSEGFGGIPIYIHELDRRWVVNSAPNIKFWKGESVSPIEGVTLVNLGGHFDGGTVLHYEKLVLAGDIITVVQDRRWASFMYSYPNLIPLPKSKILQIKERIGKFSFDSLYSAFEGKEILQDADGAVKRSAERYIRRITD